MTASPNAAVAPILLALAAAGIAPGGLVAQRPVSTPRIGTASVAELQRIVNRAAAASGAAGVQVSVILGDRRADFVAGTANAELGIPMTPTTIIQIGSSTKVLNAAMIMTLVDEGVLNLDRPVREYIPTLDLADDEAERTITLRQLLSMTSGIDNGPYPDYGGGEDGLARYVASLGTMPQVFRPGTGWGYSNTGTSIAGYAAERVTGKTWDELLKRRILDPIGMTHAVTRPQDLPFQRVAAGHTPARDGKPAVVVRPWYITQAQGPAGSTMAMSAQDLASFGRIFLNRGRAVGGAQVLSEVSAAAMMTPVVKTATREVADHWCIGLALEHWSGTPVFGHPGGNQSGVSYLKIFPEQHGVLAITVNTPGALQVFAEQVFDGFGPPVFRATRPRLTPPATPVAVTRPERYVGTYAMVGMTYAVTFDGTVLSMTATPAGGVSRSPAVTQLTLIPLEGDEFLTVDPAAPRAPARGVGFFGDDGRGRATNLVAPVFPARRVP